MKGKKGATCIYVWWRKNRCTLGRQRRLLCLTRLITSSLKKTVPALKAAQAKGKNLGQVKR